MVDTMMEQFDALKDLWDDIVGLINKYPNGSDSGTLMAEWSGIMVSTRRVVNEILEESGCYTSPVTTCLDRSDEILSARKYEDGDTSDDDSSESKDDHYTGEHGVRGPDMISH